MCNLARILSSVVIVLVASGVVAFAQPPLPIGPPPPFVNVSVPREPLNLGCLWASGSYQTGAEVKVHVIANCPYQIEASFRDLRYRRGGRITPQSWMVAINGQETSLAGRVVVAQSRHPTPPSGVDVKVALQVGAKDLTQCPAGPCEGTLVITVTAVP